MQRLVFLIDGLAVLLFLWIMVNIVHVVTNEELGGKFFWLSNKIRGEKKNG